MVTRITTLLVALFLCLMSTSVSMAFERPLIIDHNHTNINAIPQAAIEQAKANLHIVYGHTSHGSQITDGMTGLVEFANNGGRGLNLPQNIFQWNNGGTGGALDLHDGGLYRDVGYYPDWYNSVTAYLDNPANADVNVVMYSWCGQVTDKYRYNTLHSEYLNPMSELETMYPHVTFVYMTGHVDIWADADNKAANQVIRDYCIQNDKVLYDFEDIEHYNPDGTYFEYVHDTCNIYTGPVPGGTIIGNWATEWQNSHTEGVDWYNCGSAHSEPLNANLKAYAAWHLFAKLGGWEAPIQPGITVTQSSGSTTVTESGGSDSYQIVLQTQPSADVVITITPDGELSVGSGPAAAIALTFSSENWNQAQIVTVSATDDTTEEGSHTGVITHQVSSNDTSYDNFPLENISVTITDNDLQHVGVTLIESEGDSSVTEKGNMDSYQIVLTSQPAAEVTITVTPDGQLDLGNGAAGEFTLVFTDQDWNQPQSVTIAAVDDALEEGTHTSTLSHSSESQDSDYDNFSIPDLQVTIEDPKKSLLLKLISSIINHGK